MGGNLFSTKRVSRETYFKVAEEVLRAFAPCGEMSLVPCVGDKQDFGDIDIVCRFDAGVARSYIKETLPAHEISVNDGVVSFGWVIASCDAKLQVDLICRPNNFEDALAYRSYGDFGHISGSIYDYNGLSLGDTGLLFKVGTNKAGQKSFRICSFVEALPFIGISESTWRAGFDTEEDMFKSFVDSGYLPFVKFMEASGRIDSTGAYVSDKKEDDYERPALKRFSDYLWTHSSKFSLSYQTQPKEVDYQALADKFGDKWMRDAERHQIHSDTIALFRDHVNGETVSAATGLTGKELGDVMKKISAYSWIVERAANEGYDPIAAVFAHLIRKHEL